MAISGTLSLKRPPGAQPTERLAGGQRAETRPTPARTELLNGRAIKVTIVLEDGGNRHAERSGWTAPDYVTDQGWRP